MKTISTEDWQRVEVLLDKALDRPPQERTAFLRAACDEDPTLSTLLLELWDAGREAKQWLAEATPKPVAVALESISLSEVFEPAFGPTLSPGDRLGEYTHCARDWPRGP